MSGPQSGLTANVPSSSPDIACTFDEAIPDQSRPGIGRNRVPTAVVTDRGSDRVLGQANAAMGRSRLHLAGDTCHWYSRHGSLRP